MRRATVLLALAIAGLTFGIAIPNALEARRRDALQSAAVDVRSILLLARLRAAAYDRGVGIRFIRIDGVWHHVLYEDGNGDGVRREDIALGIDPPAAPPIPVLQPGPIAVEHVNDPALCVFTPDGSSSPCVISIVDDAGKRAYVAQRRLS